MKTYFIVAYRADVPYSVDKPLTASIYDTVQASTRRVAIKRARKIAEDVFWQAEAEIVIFVEALTVRKCCALVESFQSNGFNGLPKFDWQLGIEEVAQEYLLRHMVCYTAQAAGGIQNG